MRFRTVASLLFAALLALPSVWAQPAAIDFSGIPDPIAGEPTQVLVLGTPHLRGLSDRFEPADLDSLLARAEAFAPEIIAIEAVPGESCAVVTQYEALYPGVAESYCVDPAPAREATGLTGPEAEVEVREMLAAWPARPTPAQRRGLAARFLAAGNPYSAALQWLRLPESERRPADGVSEPVREELERLLASANENTQIAVRLAARLGHEQVYPVDDHTADDFVLTLGDGFGAALREVRAEGAAWGESMEAALADIGSPEGLLAYYRLVNSVDAQEGTLDADFRLALRHDTPERYGRQYVAWWQARNLRMVANLMEALGNAPEARVLALVGASHKPYYEAYLDQMHDVQVVDSATVLGDPVVVP